MIVVFILSALRWIRIRGLWKLSDGRDWLWGNLGLVVMGGARLNKSLIQFSVDGRGCVPFLLFGLRVGIKRTYASTPSTAPRTVVFSAPDPAAGHCPPTPPLETPGHSQASLAQSLVGSLLLSPGSWWTQISARRSNQSILKEISPECSLEGLMLKLKLQYSGQLMRRTDSSEKTLMLGKI